MIKLPKDAEYYELIKIVKETDAEIIAKRKEIHQLQVKRADVMEKVVYRENWVVDLL